MVNGQWLIADSGSTKTDWLFVASDGKRLELQTDGINPARDARDNIYNVLYFADTSRALPAFWEQAPTAVSTTARTSLCIRRRLATFLAMRAAAPILVRHF